MFGTQICRILNLTVIFVVSGSERWLGVEISKIKFRSKNVCDMCRNSRKHIFSILEVISVTFLCEASSFPHTSNAWLKLKIYGYGVNFTKSL